MASDCAVALTAMDVSVGAGTVRVVCPEIDPLAAVMVAVPGATAVASPVAAPTVPTAVLPEDHVAEVVKSLVEESL